MKKKLFFLAMFASCVLLTQAGTYYCGVNQLYQLLTSVTDQDGNDLTGIPHYLVWDNNVQDSVTNNSDTTWEWVGTTWTEVGGTQMIYWSGLDDSYRYRLLTSLDWSNMGYIQKPDSIIKWVQGDIYGVIDAPTDAPKNAVQDNDLQLLDNLNFSGNKFFDFELDGSGITPVTHINFSNNPTLKKLVIQNCPDLIDVDITNSGLRLSTVYSISQTVDAKLLYAPQGVVSLAFPVDAVDLSADLTLGGVATTITWEGDQPTADNNGVFTFDASLAGKTVKALLSNSKLSSFGDGVEYDITLADSSDGIPTLQAAKATVFSDKGQLFITSTANGMASIYLIDGSLVKTLYLVPGTSNIALPSNVYIVHFADGTSQKVIVK